MDEKEAIRALKDVKNILDEEDITYWLESGTLLGAVRNGRFIPWDGDIDLGLFREDYIKVKRLLKSLPDRYEVDYSKEHVFSKENIFVHYKSVDIGIHFYSVQNNYAVRHYCNILREPYISSVLRSIAKLIKNNDKGTIKKAAQNFPVEITILISNFISILPLRLKKKLISLFTSITNKFSYEETLKVAVPIKYFNNLSKMKFYGMEFNVPESAEEYLEYRYGEDWKTPKRDYVYYEEDGSIVNNQ
ncbi:MAG: LicD family protein [Thermoplasmatota archaeon]